ncbi:MAG: methionyl-tRNA formyltransferase [Phascolarctobacterium sp.]|nr:methionyl-tRNA formyltransferase [Phascolarctobacterium sp.]
MRTVFMGTPDFAVAQLNALSESGKHEILAVVTQPDRPKGRGKKVLFPPVKDYAILKGFQVFQPEMIKSAGAADFLKELRPDIIVVAAFGQILPEGILNIPKYGCINVHASLLPKYRGAAPVHYAIMNGEKETGVTIMQMDAGMDTGAMLAKVSVSVGCEITTGELERVLMEKGATLLLETMDKIAAGALKPEPQDEKEATYAHLIVRGMEFIDWTKSAGEIHNKIRALNPAPGAYTHTPSGKILKIWKSAVTGEKNADEPGKVLSVGKTGFYVATGSGILEILEVQPEGKKHMTGQVFCNGRRLMTGDVLCREQD